LSQDLPQSVHHHTTTTDKDIYLKYDHKLSMIYLDLTKVTSF